MECEPEESEEMIAVAEPALSVLVESAVAPSLKVTVPVGVPLPGAAALIVAVKTTDWPYTVGLVDEVSVAVVLSWLTGWGRGAEGVALKVLSPVLTAGVE